MDILSRIKRLVLRGNIVFTAKARLEMDLDAITDDDVIEAILNASRVTKALRSTSFRRSARREILYVIKGMTFDGISIYTKGVIRATIDRETLYVLISSKRSH